MRRDSRACLWDVIDAAMAIDAFTSGVDFSGYAGSPLIQAAVERKFEIIGEALAQLSRHNPELAGKIPGTPQIVGFRNLLIHGYAAIDQRRVWRILGESLPPLVAVVRRLLKELDPGHGGA